MNREHYEQKLNQLRASAELKMQSIKEATEQQKMLDEASQNLYQELSIHRIELEMQVDEFLRVQDELSNDKADLKKQLSLIPAAYVFINSSGRITNTNGLADEILFDGQSRIRNKMFEHLVFHEDRLIFTHTLKACEKKEDQVITHPIRLDVNSKLINGSLSVRYSKQQNPSGNYYMIFVPEQ